MLDVVALFMVSCLVGLKPQLQVRLLEYLYLLSTDRVLFAQRLLERPLN